jgi:hypothetical protein
MHDPRRRRHRHRIRHSQPKAELTLEFACLRVDTSCKTEQRNDANWTENHEDGQHHHHPVTFCYWPVYFIEMHFESVKTAKLYCGQLQKSFANDSIGPK